MTCNKHRVAALGGRWAGVLGALCLLAACGTPAGDPGAGDDLVVVAKVAPLADLTQRVVGDSAEVHSLVPAGVDAHTYEPTPSDVRLLSQADLFVANGLHLNDTLIGLAETNMGEGGTVIRLADVALPDQEIAYLPDGGRVAGQRLPNPHVWMDVRYAREYVRHIADALSDADPDGAATYRRNAASYDEQLEALDHAIAEAVSTVPAEHRKLVTYHDSWAYFAPRYGLELVAAVQPADFAEPSPAEVSRIVEEIRAQGVPAVFGSEGFSSDVVEAISREAGVEYIEDLSDDVLPGTAGDPEHSYVGMMVRNAMRIVTALGGDPAAVESVARSAGIDTERLR